MKLIGKVIVTVYHNEDNGYTVLKLKIDKEMITAVGETHQIEIGDEIEIDGEYSSHKVYGTQFTFKTCIKVLPKDRSALIQYISDNVKLIGKKTARNIVNMFEDDTVNVIRMEPDKLYDVIGLNEEKIHNLTDFFLNEWEKWNVVEYLSQFGISVFIANKIYDVLKQDTITIVKQDPYSLLEFVKTLEFKLIDEIGLKQGITKDNKNRVEYGILHCMNEITEFGHTCIEKDVLIEYGKKVLDVDIQTIQDGLVNLKFKTKIYITSINNIEYVFKRAYYIAENNIAEAVISHTKNKTRKKNYSQQIEKTSEKFSLILSEEQKNAISNCLNNHISVITGGPGTGKTTIIKCIIDILTGMKKEYILAAPTGRAAKRITETTGKEAKTLHRLLEIIKINDKDIDQMLDYAVKNIEVDFVIVDEASMIDTLMMNNLLKAINSKTSIIFVGDVNQLPSVGPGSVLKDIIDSEVVETVFLKEIYRQSAKSDIVVNAHRVNNGEYPDFKKKETDLYYIKTDSIEDTVSELSSLVSFRLNNFADIDPMKDLQILTPTKKNELRYLYAK